MDDQSSDIGAQEHFRNASVADSLADTSATMGRGYAATVGQTTGSRPVVIGTEATGSGWGRGPVAVDSRKFRYDRTRSLAMPPVSFSVTKADRLDAEEAGAVLHRIHVTLGIENESEARIAGFDAALWWQHTINGASMMQDMRGNLTVDGMEFDISSVLRVIGEHQLRRFFRAFADEIKEVNAEVIRGYDPHDFESADKYGQLVQVAASRGLHKYPALAFDAADACSNISMDARRALAASKALVVPSDNVTDRSFVRAGRSIGADAQGVDVA